MKLRDYQQQAIDSIMSQFEQRKDALLVLGTGGGKTFIFSSLVKMLQDKWDLKILLVANKNVLVSQGARELEKIAGKITFYNAGQGKKEFSSLTVASIQSLKRCDNIPPFNIIIYDEAHWYDVANCDVYNKIKLANPKVRVLGVTATPFDAYGYMYGEDKFFNKPCLEKSMLDLTKEKHLVPLIHTNGKHQVDLKGVKKSKGDYIVSQLSKKLLEHKDLIEKQIDDALQRSVNRKKIIVITTSIEHCEFVYSLLKDSAITHSKRKDRKHQEDSFLLGDKRILVSVLVASEGLDCPPADCLWLMRPTRSERLYVQACGRVVRKYQGKKDALLLDYGNVVENLGSVYSVAPGSKKASQKICEQCNTFCKGGALTCHNCNNAFTVMCEACLNMKPYGVTCECGGVKKDRNLSISNLTDVAFTDKIMHKVTKIMTKKHQGPKSEYMLITYYGKSWEPICKDFVGSWQWGAFTSKRSLPYSSWNEAETIIKENMTPPFRIQRTKNGKYWNRL